MDDDEGLDLPFVVSECWDVSVGVREGMLLDMIIHWTVSDEATGGL